MAAPGTWHLHPALVEDYIQRYRSLYELVLEEHRTAIFVDGQKSWRKAALLGRGLLPADDVRIIHLVRDPRGFACSLVRHGQARGLEESAWMWRDIHRRMSPLREIAPYHLLRYEDLALRPEAELRKLFEFLGVEEEQVVEAPKYPEKHHVVGNDMARRFEGEISLDVGWRLRLTQHEQQSVLAAAGPFAAQLGYADDADGTEATS